jgi:hypothetical protein
MTNSNKTKIILLILSLFLFSYCTPKKLNTYYGIDTNVSNKIIYLVDVSSSMGGKKEKKKFHEVSLKEEIVDGVHTEVYKAVKDAPGGEIVGIASGVLLGQLKDEKDKLRKSKKQLVSSIKGLNENASFTIIFFGSKIKKWEDNLVPASQFNKNRAIAYLK